jgi:hypothetical protein
MVRWFIDSDTKPAIKQANYDPPPGNDDDKAGIVSRDLQEKIQKDPNCNTKPPKPSDNKEAAEVPKAAQVDDSASDQTK